MYIIKYKYNTSYFQKQIIYLKIIFNFPNTVFYALEVPPACSRQALGNLGG